MKDSNKLSINTGIKKAKELLLFCVLFVLVAHPVFGQSINEPKKEWLYYFDFDATQFSSPKTEFYPFARWWWPGNDVNEEELRREIRLFAENGFGGVEIQTLRNRLPFDQESFSRVLTWDTPGYYENVRAVMDEARRKGITVDMTNGSGWPTGGAYLSPGESFVNLLFTSVDISGSKRIVTALPLISNNTGVASKLEAVVAVKTLPKNEVDSVKTISLDPTSTQIITNYVTSDTLIWDVPEGNWKVIAFWSKPNSLYGSNTTGTPSQGPVLNLFDSTAVVKSYNYLFGQRTGLEEYYGNPLRAIFTDSYEFTVDRHYSSDFIPYFKKKRGYDPVPWLPANMQEKYNYVDFMNPHKEPDFSFGTEDWRLRHDYDLTLSELLEEHFIKTSSDWTRGKGLLFRTQAYGMRLDMIALAGNASIPETETMGRGEAGLKIQSSGAHLYNRPVVSCESAVYINRSYMTTPQKLKLIVDKLFAAGINQIIYHGVPYRYITPKTIDEGWYPFGNKFSSNLGEGNIFWKYQKEINEYVGRTQYALRSGRPQADALIYLPFSRQHIPFNPEELLKDGYFEGVENPLPEGEGTHFTKEEMAWAKVFYPFINQLEAKGFTWDWINDESIQEATLDKNKQINIRGNHYQALILIDEPVIELKTARKINVLAKDGMNFLAIGNLPDKQPSFLNWEVNDKETQQQMVAAVNGANAMHVQTTDVGNWFQSLSQAIQFNHEYPFFSQVQREMKDGSRIHFVWNESDKWQPISLTPDKRFKSAYWMNAENGTITKVNKLKNVSYIIPPYSSVILYAGTGEKINSDLLSITEPIEYGAEKVLEIDNWAIKNDTVMVEDSPLFDWRNNPRLKYSSHEAVYQSSFHLDKINHKAEYFIDLGEVFYTAEIIVNGQPAGQRLFAPYSFNISDLLHEGENTIKVTVTPGQLNGFIGKGLDGNNLYHDYKNSEPLAAGLLGPVVVYQK
ncbi:glycosyl hydrolase [uncultured Draconibacterium sp.]|uniref:glycosyl hydrolase n=1 Tax=uncultured Draconibacterium sp. TaxID=1573823 RepID=UPI0032172A1E